MDYYSNKHLFSPFGVYHDPTPTVILVHMLNFGGNTLNGNFKLFISNSKKSSVPARLWYQMERGDMNYRL